MKEHVSKLISVAILGLAAGCGGPSYSRQFTCNQISSLSQCSVIKTNDTSFADSARTSCEANGGTATVDPCPRAQLLGICTLTDSDTETDVYIYPSERASTTDGAHTGCDNAKGSFSAP
jgi:putative hemolysin